MVVVFVVRLGPLGSGDPKSGPPTVGRRVRFSEVSRQPLRSLRETQEALNLGGRFGYFLFFLLGGGEGEVQGDRERGGVGFLLKIPLGGVGRMSAANLGGGLNIFFRGRNARQET